MSNDTFDQSESSPVSSAIKIKYMMVHKMLHKVVCRSYAMDILYHSEIHRMELFHISGFLSSWSRQSCVKFTVPPIDAPLETPSY